jgi:hypothetical protein
VSCYSRSAFSNIEMMAWHVVGSEWRLHRQWSPSSNSAKSIRTVRPTALCTTRSKSGNDFAAFVALKNLTTSGRPTADLCAATTDSNRLEQVLLQLPFDVHARRRHRPIARRTSARASSQTVLSLARSASRARDKAATAASIGNHTSKRVSCAAAIELCVGWRWRRAIVPWGTDRPAALLAWILALTWAHARSMSCEQESARPGSVETAPATALRTRS